MADLKHGDRVSIVERQVVVDDAKTGLYQGYFANLRGIVDRVYEDESVCVKIDLDSLPEDNRNRHLEIQESEKKRWLDSLSDEMRNRLTAEQKQFIMSYKILVHKKDLIKA